MPLSSARHPRLILITGANGQLGRALTATCTKDAPVVALGRDDLDVGRADDVRARIDELRPTTILNAAAYTAVDQAEDDTDAAFAINAEAPAILAECAARTGASFVHFSTDYVFDGRANRPYRETDPVAPLNVYGRSKLAGEASVLAANPASLILRTCWLYGPVGQNFYLTMRRLGQERSTLNVVDDQRGNPTSTAFLARATRAILANVDHDAGALRERAGIYHLSSAGEATWYDFARAILKPMAPAVTVNPVTSEAFPTRAARPAYSVLDKSLAAGNFDLDIPTWEAQLAEVEAGLKSHTAR